MKRPAWIRTDTLGTEWSRRAYSLPLTFVRSRAARTGERLRLLPPYREHLSQAFARYFIRVGLPQDIPAFC